MNKILMLDDFYLTHDDNIGRRMVTPEWDYATSYSDPAFPSGARFFSVVESVRGGYDMIFSTFAPDRPATMRAGGLTTCIAHSDDGISFGPARVLGPGGAHGQSVAVYRDEHETDPEHRYKAIEADQFIFRADGGTVDEPSYVISSPDLHNWRRHSEAEVVEGSHLDCQPSILYNPYTGRYQATLRRAHGDRRISLVESEDMGRWSQPRCVLHPGTPLDAPGTHFYSMPHFFARGQGIFVGFLWKLHMPFGRVSDGPMTTELVYSYDGLVWNRTLHTLMPIDHAFYRQTAPAGAPQACALVMSMVETAEGMIMYALVSDYEHQSHPAPGEHYYRLHTARMRADGFACYRAGEAAGSAITVNLAPRPGSDLELNYRTLDRGWVRAALCDELSREIEGFTIDDCLLPEGDNISKTIRWRGGALADAVASHPWVRLKLLIKSAELYSVSGDFYASVNHTAKLYERP